jgi:hypothetical protein
LAKKDVKLVPAMIEDCVLPRSFHFFSDTLFADFREDYETAMQRLLGVLGVRPPRRGLKLYTGLLTDLKASGPGAIQVAMWEGLRMYCKYDRFTETLAFHMSYSDQAVLEIPLTRAEISQLRGYRELAGWGYYDLHEPQEPYYACVKISYISSESEPLNLVWLLDKRRRTAIRIWMNIAAGGDDDKLFESPYE